MPNLEPWIPTGNALSCKVNQDGAADGHLVWAKVELTMHATVEVYLGDLAQISCQYSFTDTSNKPSTIMIQWFVRAAGNSSRIRIFYSDQTEQMVDNNTEYSGRIHVTSHHQETQLTIQDVLLFDQREFFCQVNGLAAGNAEGKTHLKVFAPPEAPVIEGVLSGISVINEEPSKVASCESRNGFPKPNITWYKNSMLLIPTLGYVNVLILVTRESSGFYSVQSTLEYMVEKEDKDAIFSCEVSFFVPGAIKTVESNGINITVHYPTTMVELWKDSPQGLVKEGDTVELRCQGDGNPPPPFLFNKEPEPDVDLDSRDDLLILTAVTRQDSGVYQCHPVDTDGTNEVKGQMQLTVHYLDPAVVVPKESELMFKGESLTATCNAPSSLKTSTVWYKDGKQMGQGNMLLIQDASYETTGEYVCEVTVSSLPTLHTVASVHIIVQGGPHLVGVDREVQQEEETGQMVNLSCEAQGHPLPSIDWSITGSQNWYEVVKRANDHMTHSVVSVKVTSDISALCNASNDMGSEVKAFTIKAIPTATSTAPFSPGSNGALTDGKQMGQGNMLLIQDASYETTGEYVCEVTVSSLPTLHTVASVHIIVQGGPHLVGVDREVQQEEETGQMVNLSCEAQGHPLPSIDWSITGSQNWYEVVKRANDHMTHSVVSVKVTSDISALCNASNDMGSEVKAFTIKAIPTATSTAPFSPAEGSGVIIVAIILSLLLLAILGSVLYFLHKKGKVPCGRSGKHSVTNEKSSKDDIVAEMKTSVKNEGAVLLKEMRKA
ncbi:cell surface glycoprotein MUC18 [Thalassophryne amazonica]|uniref:cell surface glycoprotein MUC18 n=1 Tax=Thalassophryne amazonica TaxID=390379 RepID=UPI0014714FB9|nr:cell surface glycoprotein MUC18 [Thalassophryne amazonica]